MCTLSKIFLVSYCNRALKGKLHIYINIKCVYIEMCVMCVVTLVLICWFVPVCDAHKLKCLSDNSEVLLLAPINKRARASFFHLNEKSSIDVVKTMVQNAMQLYDIVWLGYRRDSAQLDSSL